MNFDENLYEHVFAVVIQRVAAGAPASDVTAEIRCEIDSYVKCEMRGTEVPPPMIDALVEETKEAILLGLFHTLARSTSHFRLLDALLKEVPAPKGLEQETSATRTLLQGVVPQLDPYTRASAEQLYRYWEGKHAGRRRARAEQAVGGGFMRFMADMVAELRRLEGDDE